MKTLITAIVIALTATSVSAKSKEWLITNFGNTSTEAQRVHSFEQVEDAQVSINGYIQEVDTPGWLTKEYTVSLWLEDDVIVYCRVPAKRAKEVVKLRLGQNYTCEGRLSSYISLFGVTGLNIYTK